MLNLAAKIAQKQNNNKSIIITAVRQLKLIANCPTTP